MVGDAGGMQWATSENLGVGRLTAELVHDDPPSKADRKRLQARLIDVLGPLADLVAGYEPKMVVGSSGTLEDLAHMVAARRKGKGNVPVSLNQLMFSRDEFLELHHDILAATASERRRMDGLEARRIDLIPAGSMFLATAMELFGFDEMTVSEWALREGIVLEAIGRHDPEDWSDDPRAIRRSSVQSLARRCNWPEAHSRQVAKLALELFDQLRELHGLDDDDRELLEYAALLHDVGEHVSTVGHHKHAAYLIEHGQLRGFDPEEVHMLAALARWHLRGEPKLSDELRSLGPGGETRLRRLAASATRCRRTRPQPRPGRHRFARTRRAVARARTRGPRTRTWSSSCGARGASGRCSRRSSTASSKSPRIRQSVPCPRTDTRGVCR